MYKKKNKSVNKPRPTALTPVNSLVVDFHMQYTSTAALANLSIKWASMLNLLCVSKTTTTASSVYEAIRIRKIRVLIPALVQTSATVVVVPNVAFTAKDANAIGIGAEKRTVMTCGSAAQVFTWKPRGLAADWVSTTFVGSLPSEACFGITSTGCIPIIELFASLRLVQSGSMAAAATDALSTTVDTTTAGALFYSYLDSLETIATEGSLVLAPINVQTITVNMPLPKTCSCPRNVRCRCNEACVASSSPCGLTH